jgi:proteasome lid subunit RPN8/RPN11
MTAKVMVTDEVMRGLRRAAAAGLPNEAGGILLGGLDGDRPWVSAFAEIPSVTPSPAQYRIPEGVTQEIVDATRQRDPRIGYLGDWHSHPANLQPSPTDRATSIRSASDPAAGIKNPLLVVARQTEVGWDFDFLEARGRHHVVCEVELTGPTPPPPPTGAETRPPLRGDHRALRKRRG